MIYLVTIVNIYPESDLHQNYILTCYTQFLQLQVLQNASKEVVFALVEDVSEQAREMFQSCVDGIPTDSLPSVSEAVDHWRGVSAVLMAVEPFQIPFLCEP